MRFNANMKSDSFIFTNYNGKRLAGRLCMPDGATKSCVIFCHGLFSTKDGYKITMLTDDIVQAGFALFTFDFSCVGKSDGNIEDVSILQEINDLENAVLLCKEKKFEKIHLFGSSMGALICLLFAQNHAESISSLSLIAPPLNLNKLLIKATGVGNFTMLPCEGKTPLDGIFLKNTFFIEACDIFPEKAAQEISLPVLIIQGARDEVVDVENAYRLMQCLRGTRKLVIIGDGDHNLTRDIDLAIIRRELIAHVSANACDAY